MNFVTYILLFISLSLFAQTKVETVFVNKTKIAIDHIAGLDHSGSLVYINTNGLFKQSETKKASYANIQLGEITSANAFNSLKINVFYQDFNTAVILDNRLNEIYRIDFNKIQPARNVTFISTGNDNTLWLYNQDTQQLEVYDYKKQISRVKTLPIDSDVLDLKSNFNSAWILTKAHLLSYNYFGSLTSKIENNDYTAIAETNENIILMKDGRLFYLADKSKEIIPIQLPKLLIKAFFATDETLYIYDGEFLHQYLIKTN